MTQQRLAELLAEFEAKRDAVDALEPMSAWPYSSRVNGKHRYLWSHDIDECAAVPFDDTWSDGDPRHPHVKAMVYAARRFIIARDNGIFDDSWEVMWKLRFGGSL